MLRITPRIASSLRQVRLSSTFAKVLYTSETRTAGSRANGRAVTKEGNLDLKMRLPPSMGGGELKEGTSNPEQLFGIAYSTCFLGALAATHQRLFPDLKPLSPTKAAVRARVSIGTVPEPGLGFQLAVHLAVLKPVLVDAGLSADQIKTLIRETHAFCPYSRAVKNNIEVSIDVVEE